MGAILFALVLVGLIALPFLPLIVELYTSRDVAPLAIDEDLPIDASRLTSRSDRMEYVPQLDADCADFTGVIAASQMRVRSACRFRHLYGMPIVFGPPREPPPDHTLGELYPVSMPDLLAGMRHRAGTSRYLIFGNLTLPANVLVEANLIVNGSLHIGESSLVQGSIKASSIDVGAGATVRGAVFARREVWLRADSVVEGVLSVDGPLWIDRAWIGRANNAVSVCAAEIGIRGGACVFGQMVAARAGRFDRSPTAVTALEVSGREG
jgi:hypothetical protein